MQLFPYNIGVVKTIEMILDFLFIYYAKNFQSYARLYHSGYLDNSNLGFVYLNYS